MRTDSDGARQSMVVQRKNVRLLRNEFYGGGYPVAFIHVSQLRIAIRLCLIPGLLLFLRQPLLCPDILLQARIHDLVFPLDTTRSTSDAPVATSSDH
jgi:hypothetical protein